MREDQNIEFKQSWRDEYLKWICGFANADGGVLIIGRDDRGVVTGVSDTAKLLEDIPNKIRDILGLVVDVNLRSDNDKDYLEIEVDAQPYPVSYKGQYHYRSGSTKQELKGSALAAFLLRKQGKHWDGVPVPGVSVEDLDPLAFEHFRKQATRSKRMRSEDLQETDAVLINKLQLMEGDYLKKAAILLFHPDPEQYVTGAFIKIGFFHTNADLLYHDDIHGNLFTQVSKALDLLLTKYTKAAISYDGPQRVETYPVPEDALREALHNAVAHKDYSSGAPIQISVYDDKIMFWNPGHLPQDWGVEQLLEKHSSDPFNPAVANVFFRTGMIEAWGRGIEHIIEACHDANVPAPELKYEHSGLWVEFPFAPMSNMSGVGNKDTTQEVASVQTSVESSGKSSGKGSGKILELLKTDGRLTIPGIAEQLGVTTRAIEKNIRKLQNAGCLQRIGGRKEGHWEVLPFVTKTPLESSEKTTQEIVATTQETTQEKLITILEKCPKSTRKDLAVAIGISSDGIKYHLEKLISTGVIKHIGSTKSGHWEVLK